MLLAHVPMKCWAWMLVMVVCWGSWFWVGGPDGWLVYALGWLCYWRSELERKR